MKNDKNAILAAMKSIGVVIENSSANSVRDIYMSAVKQSYIALQFLLDSLRNDKEIVLTEMNKSWLAYLYASDTLKNDKQVLEVASQKPMLQFRKKFGSKGSGNGQCNGPFFVTADKEGNIYVSDSGNH